MTRSLTHIRCRAASTLEIVYNTGSQELGNSILKKKERGLTLGRTKNKANVNIKKGSITESSDLIAILKTMWASEKETEVNYFLRSSVNRIFGIKYIVEETVSKIVKHV